MIDIDEKQKTDELENYNGKWRILILTNKGQFLSPQTFDTKKIAEEFIEKLKKAHKEIPLRQWNGEYNLIAKLYIAVRDN